jgi:DNA-binding transcriptional MerR regulator
MQWTIPGTVLQIPKEEADSVEARFSSMFLAGGIVLSQVANITGLEPYTIQNWVKRGFLPPPQHRRYSINQLCRILNINMLKSVLNMETVCRLMEYINGKLDEESDDIIDDARLYFLFVRLAARAKQLDDPSTWNSAMEEALADYREPVPGARERVDKALRIMMLAWIAARTHQAAEQLLQEL